MPFFLLDMFLFYNEASYRSREGFQLLSGGYFQSPQKVTNYLKVQKVDYKITCIYHAIFGTSFVLKFLYLRNICSMSIFLLFCFDLIFLTSGYNQSGTWCRGRGWIWHPPCPFFFKFSYKKVLREASTTRHFLF